MEWLCTVGAVLGAWIVLNLLSSERHQRVLELELREAQRRQHAETLRQLERSAPVAVEITAVNFATDHRAEKS